MTNQSLSNPTPASQEAKPFWRNLDIVSTGAFIGAGILGLGSLAVQIRHRFHQAIVHGFNEVKTPYYDIIKKYAGDQSNPATRGIGSAFYEPLEKLEAGTINPLQYAKEVYSTATAYRNEVNQRTLDLFGIHSKGFWRGWVEGSYKRWQMLSINGRRESAIGFATVAAITIGAYTLLRHNKKTLDAMDDKLDGLRRDLLQSHASQR